VSELNEQEITRRESLQKIQDLGINPYPAQGYETNTTSKCIMRFLKNT
jgi:lysyl-tRNA synthetase class 2